MNLWIDTSGLSAAETLFGVAPLERLRRSIRGSADADQVTLSGPGGGSWQGARVDTESAEPTGARLRRALASADAPLIVLDGANVIDPRLIRFLGKDGESVVAERGEGSDRAVAMRLDAAVVDAVPADAPDLRAVASALLASRRAVALDETRFPAYIDKLRRTLPYWIHAVSSADKRRTLERRLFWDNYKGSTDLLTAYVYPPLVWPMTRFCARFGIHPNAVTVLSVILAFAAVPLWAGGHWLAGFVCAYVMSVLDSVDGKLARLTLTDSRIGNTLDHGLDQVHPPFWYFAWAWGLGARGWDDPLFQLAVWFVVFYVADRLVLMVSKRRLGHALHSSTRLDERVRSIIARRNITMSVMAIALLLGQGAAGFVIVTVWQALTFVWHGWRTIWLGFLTSEYRSKEIR